MTEITDIHAALRPLPGPLNKRASLGQLAVNQNDLSDLVRAMEAPGKPQNLGMGPGIPFIPGNQQEGAPRLYQYPVGYNINQQPRAYSASSFAVLRALSENYDVARIAIETRIAEMRALDWNIIPTSKPGISKREALKRAEGLESEIESCREFWTHPDGVSDFGTWTAMWLDDILSIDAPTMFLRPTRDGSLASVEIIDGATIRPIIDLYGRIAEPPEPAYGQVMYGQTWGLYTQDQMVYSPFRRRTNSPYGYPPLEWVMLTVNRALRRQTLDLTNYTEGTMPSAFYKMPEGWTGTQLNELQQILDDLMHGNDIMRSRVRLMPGGAGSGLERIHPEPTSAVEEWLMTVTAAAFGTTPSELGFQPRGIGLGGKGFQEAQEAINYRKSLRPLGSHMKYQIDQIIQGAQGHTDLQFQYTGLIEESDQLKQAQTDEIYWRIGAYSSDFIAKKLDVDPPGLGPIIAYNGNVIPVAAIIAQYGEAGDVDPQSPQWDTDTNQQMPTPGLQTTLPKAGSPMDSPQAPAGQKGAGTPQTVPAAVASRGAPSGGGFGKVSEGEDISRWRRKAIKSVRNGLTPDVPFVSEAIGPGKMGQISLALSKASTLEDVRAAFDAHQNAQTGLVAAKVQTTAAAEARLKAIYEAYFNSQRPRAVAAASIDAALNEQT